MSINWDWRLEPKDDEYEEEEDEMRYEEEDLALHIMLEDRIFQK